MITDVCELLADELFEQRHVSKSGYITHLSGLVRPMVVKYKGADNKVDPRSVPISFKPSNIEGGDEQYLVPDENKGCIVFFEASESVPRQALPEMLYQNTVLSVVVWFNAKRFAFMDFLTTRLIQDIDRVLRTIPGDDFGPLGFELSAPKIYENSPAVFRGYSFNDSQSGMLSQPYGYFRLEYQVKLKTNEACFDTPIALPAGDTGGCFLNGI